MDHIIEVSFVVEPQGEAVIATANPLPERGPAPPPPRTVVSPGDTVTWRFPPERHLQVLLKQQGTFPNLVFGPSRGPFSSLSVGVGQIVGTISPGVPTNMTQSTRFTYDLFENGRRLRWANNILDGGIDIPRTPP